MHLHRFFNFFSHKMKFCFLVVSFTALLFSCGKAKPKVGVMIPVKGEQAFLGRSIIQGIETALSQASVEVELIVEDVPCDQIKAIESFQRLVKDGVVAIVGPTCLETFTSVAGLSELSEVVVITPTLTDKVASEGEYVFRTMPSMAELSKKLGQIIYEEGYHRLGILYPASIKYQEFILEVSRVYKQRGGKIISQQSFNQESLRLKNSIIRIKAEVPDAILLISDNQHLVPRALELLSSELKYVEVFGVDGAMGLNFLPAAYAEGMRLILPSTGDGDFLRKYELLYNTTPDFYATTAYDAMIALTTAFDLNYLLGEEIRDFLYKNEFKGANGYFVFDENGDTAGTFRTYEIRQGKLCPIFYADTLAQDNTCISFLKKVE